MERQAAKIAATAAGAAVFSSAPEPSHEVLAPARQSLPLVLASPHSGRFYPPEFVADARLDPLALRRSEDSFVDELFDFGPQLGAPLLRAHFARAYVDPNREPYELDPTMFADPLPDFANTRSPRVAAGLGTLARIVAGGAEIYKHKLRIEEALARIERHYRPYHACLQRLIAETRAAFGYCLLIDCHSMPSTGGPTDRDPGAQRVDFVLGDCHGSACAPAVIETVEESLKAAGYRVARNIPYSGGFVTRHYGRPADGVHALQIEINRALYMDEEKIARKQGMARLSADLKAAVERLAALDPGIFGHG
jgi:N-formylglutamate amidohydrolase